MGSIVRVLNRWAVAAFMALFPVLVTGMLFLPQVEAQGPTYALSARLANGTKTPLCTGSSVKIYADTLQLVNPDDYDPAEAPNDQAPGTVRPVSNSFIGYDEPALGSIAIIREASNTTGPAIFLYKPTEAGIEKLHLYAKSFPLLSHQTQGFFADTTLEFEVVECAYEISFIFQWQYTSPDFNAWMLGSMTDGQIRREDEQYTGAGNFVLWNTVAFPGSNCSGTVSGFRSLTTITGHLDDSDNLVLQFEYAEGQQVTRVTCSDWTGTGSDSQSFGFDPDQGGIKNATFPAQGGTQSFPIQSAAGTTGTMTIIVQPKKATE